MSGIAESVLEIQMQAANPIKAVIFDLDNTLYNESAYFLAVSEQWCIENGMNISLSRRILDYLDSTDVFRTFLDSIGWFETVHYERLFEIYQTIECEITLYDEAVEILDYLSKRGIKIAVLTNGVLKAQQNKVRLLGLAQYDIAIVYARENGKKYEKPHNNAFMRALSALGVEASDTLMVGDSESTDIIGANNITIPSVYVGTGVCPSAIYSIGNLIEIKGIV